MRRGTRRTVRNGTEPIRRTGQRTDGRTSRQASQTRRGRRRAESSRVEPGRAGRRGSGSDRSGTDRLAPVNKLSLVSSTGLGSALLVSCLGASASEHRVESNRLRAPCPAAPVSARPGTAAVAAPRRTTYALIDPHIQYQTKSKNFSPTEKHLSPAYAARPLSEMTNYHMKPGYTGDLNTGKPREFK